jgi:hypothetical protein
LALGGDLKGGVVGLGAFQTTRKVRHGFFGGPGLKAPKSNPT